ncbi:MAG: hypothetical protein DRP64_17510 [Verrucomicrobia bacterium]|nr:MAG: hypothetical protein DRP64_17510 [Verrucomicrobiota bacterium]
MKCCVLILALILAVASLGDDLSQLYEKAYFLETAKGQTEEALTIYREIAATEATAENKVTIRKTLTRMQLLYGPDDPSSIQRQRFAPVLHVR